MFFRNNLYRNILLIVVIAGLLFAPVPTDNLWWREAINSGHTLLFVFLAFVIYPQITARLPGSSFVSRYFYVLVIGLLLGLLIEVMQLLVDREASLADLYGNFLGLMSGLCLLGALKLKKLHQQKMIAVLLIISSVGFFSLGMTPLARLSWHYAHRANAFPVIMDFDADWSTSFVRHDKGHYPGVSVTEPEPDWSDYQQLRFGIHSVSERDMTLVLRIHDRAHNQEISDRFNMKLLVQPGRNDFKIPLSEIQYGPIDRELDLKNIAGIILFAGKQDDWVRVEVSNFALQ